MGRCILGGRGEEPLATIDNLRSLFKLRSSRSSFLLQKELAEPRSALQRKHRPTEIRPALDPKPHPLSVTTPPALRTSTQVKPHRRMLLLVILMHGTMVNTDEDDDASHGQPISISH